MCGTAHPEPTPESSTGLLWVLVVDDEEIVRCGLDTMLGMLPRVARRDAISSWDELRPLVRGCELPDIVLAARRSPPAAHPSFTLPGCYCSSGTPRSTTSSRR